MTRTRCQPIAIADVLHCLVAVLDSPAAGNRRIEIGGPDVLTYREMMQRYAAVAGLRRRLILGVPVLTPRLSSHWVNLITPLPIGLARPLVDSLRHDVVVTDRGPAAALLGTRRPLPFDEALRRALAPAPRRLGKSCPRADDGTPSGGARRPVAGQPAGVRTSLVMLQRAVHFGPGRCAVEVEPSGALPEAGWVWIDITAGPDDHDELAELVEQMGLDALALRDAVEDVDLPKVDDFGTFMLVVLHALSEDRIETYELDCFLSERRLVTVHDQRSPSVDALWEGVLCRPEVATGGPDETLARLADVATRRLVSVLEVFDDRNEELIDLALNADADFLIEITAVRADVAALRRVVHPQREMLDVVRHSTSPLVSDLGRRRFSDVFDTASRAAQGVDGARTALAETLDAYRGAEARQATEVTKVLTVYAAIMLPLSLVAGFFGMNFVDLPLLASPAGWIIVTGFMAFIALLSLGVFVALGWTRRTSGRTAGAILGRGLVEAARAPAQLVGAVFEISTMPMRSVAESVTGVRRPKAPEPDSD